ncbi:MAG: hypothetical protein VYB52_01195 [Candidatus Neomarinimicrobiota bacterium]|nr:hypothetical protein [Candidatus Neomarinimicrobiota bacterium]
MKHLWLILFVIIGCASTTQSFPKPNTAGLKTGNVRIKLSRVNEYVGKGVTFKIYDNGSLVGKLGLDKSLEWDRPAGLVNLSRDWNIINGAVSNNAISFKAKEGYIYELYVGWYDGFTNKASSDIASKVLANMVLSQAANISASSMSFGSGRANGCNVYGKIKFVDFGEDYKVKFVDFGENIKVKYVDFGESQAGNWKVVDFGEDYKIKVVEFGEDFTVKTVSFGQGCK